MLARSAWTWIVLITGWASIVASKSPATVYEIIFSYHIYNIAWEYRGADQEYIYRLLDPVKDQKLFDTSYRQYGHRGSLVFGQMDWKEFCLAWFNDDTLGRENIPELDPKDLSKTAAGLMGVRELEQVKTTFAAGSKTDVAYHTLLLRWRKMIDEARAHFGDFRIAADLEGIAHASERAAEIRRYEFKQMKFLGEEMKKQLPGIDIKSKRVSIPELGKSYTVFDLLATLGDPDNQAKMPKALGLSEPSGWPLKFIQKVNEYGVTAFGPDSGPQRARNKKAAAHWRVLIAVDEFDRIAKENPLCEEE